METKIKRYKKTVPIPQKLLRQNSESQRKRKLELEKQFEKGSNTGTVENVYPMFTLASKKMHNRLKNNEL